ncbi:hypothetical protein F4860DRAFT_57525 [Xylaria cubensis]|nr:hypothetical protein F4860DRAFT_57525 [Xylaria cubensis]
MPSPIAPMIRKDSVNTHVNSLGKRDGNLYVSGIFIIIIFVMRDFITYGINNINLCLFVLLCFVCLSTYLYE